MDLYHNAILAELPAELPSIIPLEFFSSDRISVLKAQHVFAEERSFDCQKFLISYNPTHPALRIKNTSHKLGPQTLFSVSPGQLHGFVSTTEVPTFNAIFIDHTYVTEMGRELFGTTRISFENCNNKISPYLQQLLNSFVLEFKNKQPGYEFALQALNIQIVVNLLRATINNLNNKEPRRRRYHDLHRVKKVIEFFQENYTRNFTLDEIAQEVNYSQFHLLRIFKDETGKTPFAYLRDLKLERACELLRTSDKTITEICFASGFNNRSHFSSTFKRIFGITPADYRKQYLGDGIT